MLNKLILGTVQFGLSYGINNQEGLLPEEKVNQILKSAFSSGINTLDTAAGYGDSEKRIGAFHENNPPFKVITKFSKTEGEMWETSLQRSLDIMKIESVETVMFHSYKSFLDNEKNIDKIITSSKGRLFKTLGVSVYTNQELNALKEVEEIEVVQLPFNMLDNEQQRGIELRELKRLGKEIHTRSCFLQGLFFRDEKNLPGNLKALEPFLTHIKNLARDCKIEIGHLALQYVLNKEYIDSVLFGVDSLQQLEQNLQWANKKLPVEIFYEIDRIKVKDTDLLNPSKWQIIK